LILVICDDYVAKLLSVSAYTVSAWRRGKREMPDSLIELLQLKLKAADTIENIQINNMIAEFKAAQATATGLHNCPSAIVRTRGISRHRLFFRF